MPKKRAPKTENHWERLRIGASLVKQLEPKMTVKQVAAELGMSETAVRNIECRALYKVAMALRMRALADNPTMRLKEIELLA